MHEAALLVAFSLVAGVGLFLGHSMATNNLDCASAVIQHGEVRCIAFVDRTYKP